MPETSEKTYVWAIEWTNPFASPPNNQGMTFYRVTLHPDVKAEDFETFLREEGFPAVGGILTRAIRFDGPQYLLKEDADDLSPDPLDTSQVAGITTKLQAFGTYKIDHQFLTVLSSDAPSSE
jgi:hypothetical protein